MDLYIYMDLWTFYVDLLYTPTRLGLVLPCPSSLSDPRDLNYNPSQMVRRIVPTCLSADGASPQPKMDFYRKEIDTYSDTPHYGQEIGIQLTSTDQRDASDQPLGTS